MGEHEQQYRALYNEAPIAYFLVSSDTRIKMVNRRAVELLGYSVEDLVGRPVFELYADTPEGKEKAQAVFERFLAGGEVRGEELEMRRADGGSLWISLTVRAIRDARGEVVGSRSMAVDITDRKRAEERLRESEEKFRTFLELLPDGLVIVDRTGHIEIVNAQAEKVFSYTRDELLGRPVETLLPERFRDVHVRHRTDYYSDPRTRRMGIALDLFGRRKSGSEFPVDILLSPVEMRDEIHVISIIRDITEQKRSEEALWESEARFRDLYDQAPVGYIESDIEGRISRVNCTMLTMLGYTAEEMLGRRPWEFILEQETSRRAVAAKLSRAEPLRSYERTWRRKDGTSLLVLMQDQYLQDADGQIVGLRTTLHDITERKQLERQLFQAQKMESIGTLAGGIAHDFNNLLTSIIGFTQLALMDEGISLQVRDYIAKIPEQGKRAAQLISQLLTFSRKAITQKQPMSLVPLVKETVKMLEHTVPETIAIRVRVSGETSPVNADPTQMQQVIMNLCVNASQAMPRGGELTVGLADVTLDEAYCRKYAYARPGRHVCLSVRDTGVGMTPEVQMRIFEPFFTTKGVGEGTGLGLAVIYGIVKGHEGHINVYSEVGKGSEFKVYLPAMNVGAPLAVAPEQEPPPGGTETLLLVEDDPTVLATGRAMLERLGYTVLTAADGEEALEVYGAHRGEIALVLTDMVMPRMGGEELYDALRQTDAGVKLALMSGYSMNQDLSDLRAKGLRGFVQKPLDFYDLGQAVRRALDEACSVHPETS